MANKLTAELSELDRKLFEEVMDAVNATIMQMVSERAGHDRKLTRIYCVVAGKALVTSGCQFLGNALELGPDEGLAPAYACVAEYQRLARVKSANERSS
jgi:hypothetical protein